jgi:hypothetical protein
VGSGVAVAFASVFSKPNRRSGSIYNHCPDWHFTRLSSALSQHERSFHPTGMLLILWIFLEGIHP